MVALRLVVTDVALRTDARGSSFIEYLVVLGFCALLIAPTIWALGIPLLRWFRFTQLVLLSPV